jgi:allantoate deiminase
MITLAEKVIQCCRDLARFTETPGRTTRTFLSPPMRDVHGYLAAWMREVSMDVWADAAGNLRGFRAGLEARRLVIASHLDTVPDAGAFDGILGVVMGVALLEATAASDQRFGIEVIGFSEEEGVRFGLPFIGSRAVMGTLGDPGEEIRGAIRDFGLDPERLPQAKLDADAFAYLEFHIEQGPVLESLNLMLGVVEGIAGQSRLVLTFCGKANHAGTTPMSLRKDALAAAAEWILEVEKIASEQLALVATTGSIRIDPNASNVIPGEAIVSLDVRHSCDATRQAAVDRMIETAAAICDRRGVRLKYEYKLDQPAVSLDEELTAKLATAVELSGVPVHRMISGAGHDAMIVAPQLPSAMLFLRSPGGDSHHPDENVFASDVAAALKAGVEFLRYV